MIESTMNLIENQEYNSEMGFVSVILRDGKLNIMRETDAECRAL